MLRFCGENYMQRRNFIALLGRVFSWPFLAHAQQKAMPVIGLLGGTSPDSASPGVAGFRQGLSEAGWVEGQNVAVEYRYSEGRHERLAAFAADFVGRKVDVILAAGDPAAFAARDTTATIPIIFSFAGDPVEQGLVVSFARPGGNLTGMAIMFAELIPKRFELLTELVPLARVFALMVNPNSPGTEPMIREMQKAARAKGVQLCVLKSWDRKRDRRRFCNPRPGTCRRARRQQRHFLLQRAPPARSTGGAACRPHELFFARVRGCRRADQLWCKGHGHLSPSRQLRGKNPERCEAGRSAGPAADYIRAGRQPEDRQGARSDRAAVDPRTRR
jgi:hypothetical protein